MNTHHYHQYQQWRVVVAVDERQVEKEEIPKKVSKVFEERTRMQDLWYEQGQQGVVIEEGQDKVQQQDVVTQEEEQMLQDIFPSFQTSGNVITMQRMHHL